MIIKKDLEINDKYGVFEIHERHGGLEDIVPDGPLFETFEEAQHYFKNDRTKWTTISNHEENISQYILKIKENLLYYLIDKSGTLEEVPMTSLGAWGDDRLKIDFRNDEFFWQIIDLE